MLLTIDSSIGTVVGVTGLQGNCLSSASVEDRRSHAEAIGPLIARALSEATITPADITGVVMGVGPGPFTGLRVGMAAATAFAKGRGVPLLPVLSHDSAAWEIARDTLVVSDARRGELAVTRYQPEPGRSFASRVGDTTLVSKNDIPEQATEHDGADVVWLESVDPCRLARAVLWYQHHGVELLPEQAVYLRAPDVTMPS
jgi:tRNA threonylcarbamoyladenosine biosynthesis protein TsaB